MAPRASLATRAAKDLEASVRVGAFDLDVYLGDNAMSDRGLYDPQEKAIHIATDLASPQEVVEVFLHELTHAVYDHGNLADADGEEKVVTVLALGFTQIYRDNPWLIRWIAKWTK